MLSLIATNAFTVHRYWYLDETECRIILTAFLGVPLQSMYLYRSLRQLNKNDPQDVIMRDQYCKKIFI